MYLIGSGRAKVIAHLMGKAIELAELGEGDLFGEVAFLTGRPRTAEVVAAGPLKVFEIKRWTSKGSSKETRRCCRGLKISTKAGLKTRS